MKDICLLKLKITPMDNNIIHGSGKEIKREDTIYTNQIEEELSCSNVALKKLEGTLDSKLKEVIEKEGYSQSVKAKGLCMVVISADPKFFQREGFIKGRKPPKKIEEFFQDSYNFLCKYLGDDGSDKNILAAYIHYDEINPHLQAYVIPVCKYKYTEINKIENGIRIYSRDENGKISYIVTELQNKMISWGNLARHLGNGDKFEGYRFLAKKQEEEVGVKYGLYKSTGVMNKKSLEPIEWRYKKLLEKIEENTLVYNQLFDKVKDLEKERDELVERLEKSKQDYESLKEANEILKKALENSNVNYGG